ncbi:hypothetical protein BC937DRAFT_90741 [Endogone sp. FLAS-F59071]|nr:hypothetical protein BC937DRAFT_90741 [Endogone sp. FLAS-F59071]|eukprot:RUS21981.1 hypothetical protein BC937DRAFT_90741 [Endogone sp. FLAS-F59071]
MDIEQMQESFLGTDDSSPWSILSDTLSSIFGSETDEDSTTGEDSKTELADNGSTYTENESAQTENESTQTENESMQADNGATQADNEFTRFAATSFESPRSPTLSNDHEQTQTTILPSDVSSDFCVVRNINESNGPNESNEKICAYSPSSKSVFVAPTPQCDPYWNTLLAKYDDGGLSGINDWLEDMEKRKPSNKNQPSHDGEETPEKENERFLHQMLEINTPPATHASEREGGKCIAEIEDDGESEQNQPSEDEKGLNRKLSCNGEVFKTPVETWLTSSAIPHSTFPTVPLPPARQDNRPNETHKSNRYWGTENEYSKVEVMTRPTCKPKLKPMAYVDETFIELFDALTSTASPASASSGRFVSSNPTQVKTVNMARSASPASAKVSEYGRDTNRYQEAKALSSTVPLRTLEVGNDDPIANQRSFSCARETQQNHYFDHPTSPRWSGSTQRRLPATKARPVKRLFENRDNSDDGRDSRRIIDEVTVSMKQSIRVVEAEVAGKIVTVSLQDVIASESVQQGTGQRTDDDAGPAQGGRSFGGDLGHERSVHAQDCEKDTEEEAPDEFESGRSCFTYSNSAEGGGKLAKVIKAREFNMPTLLGSPPSQSNCNTLSAAQVAWLSFSEGRSANSETLVSSFANVNKPKEIRHFAPTFEVWPKLSTGYIHLQQKRLGVNHGSRIRSAVVSKTELEILKSLTLRPDDATQPATREQTGVDPSIQAILRQGEAWFGQLKAAFSNSSDKPAEVRIWELEQRDTEKNRTMEILVRCVNDMFEERRDLLEQLQRLNQRERRWWQRNEPDDEASDVV